MTDAELITRSVTHALAEIARTSGTPVIDGILTTYTMEQAIIRSGGEKESRGWYCGLAAIEMARVLQKLKEASP